MPARVVADSNCDLPPELVTRYDIRIVPSLLNLAGQSYRDGLDLSRAEFYHRLPRLNPLPTTAAPSAGTYTDVFRDCGDDPIVCVTLAAAFSAIYNAARLGAEPLGEQVTLVDSGTLSMAMGWQVLAAAEAAHAGETVPAVLERIRAVQQSVRLYAVLDTLEYLRRGGRASLVSALVGELFQVKPLLEVRAGRVSTLIKVRTQSKARAELISRVEALGPLQRLAVLHTACEDAAHELAARLAPHSAEAPLVVEATAVIGVHVGPGALAVAPVVRTTTSGEA